MARALTTVIATNGRPDLLRRTLESLAACIKPTLYRGTIIVENGVKAGAEEVVRSCHPSLSAQYLYQHQGNKCHALNTALEQVGEGLIFFTDDDVRIHPDTLCAYADATAKTGGGQFFGGPIGVDYDVEPPEWLSRYLPFSARGWRLDGGVQVVQKPRFLGFNWAAFAKDIRDAGGFNPSLGPGATTLATVGDEPEIQARLVRNGVRGVYIPEAVVWHYVPEERCSPKWALRRAYHMGVSSGMQYVTEVPTVLGFPRWVLRECPRRGFVFVQKTARGDKYGRFDAYYNFLFFCGYVWGTRIVRTQSPKRFVEVG